MNDLITSTQAAELLGVTRRTLLRWEERGWLSPQRDESGKRIYRADDIKLVTSVWDRWTTIRRIHREHLRKLPAIQKEAERFIVTTPLTGTEVQRGLFLFERMTKAFSDMNQWQRESQKIDKMYDEFLSSELVDHVSFWRKGLRRGGLYEHD